MLAWTPRKRDTNKQNRSTTLDAQEVDSYNVGFEEAGTHTEWKTRRWESHTTWGNIRSGKHKET